jgi:hypothetical protein
MIQIGMWDNESQEADGGMGIPQEPGILEFTFQAYPAGIKRTDLGPVGKFWSGHHQVFTKRPHLLQHPRRNLMAHVVFSIG